MGKRSVSRSAGANGKTSLPAEVSRCQRIASNLADKIEGEGGLAELAMATTADMLNDNIPVKKANSAFTGIGRITKIAEMQLKYGDAKTRSGPLALIGA